MTRTTFFAGLLLCIAFWSCTKGVEERQNTITVTFKLQTPDTPANPHVGVTVQLYGRPDSTVLKYEGITDQSGMVQFTLSPDSFYLFSCPDLRNGDCQPLDYSYKYLGLFTTDTTICVPGHLQSSYQAVGRLLDENGNPVTNGEVLGLKTDEQGRFSGTMFGCSGSPDNWINYWPIFDYARALSQTDYTARPISYPISDFGDIRIQASDCSTFQTLNEYFILKTNTTEYCDNYLNSIFTPDSVSQSKYTISVRINKSWPQADMQLTFESAQNQPIGVGTYSITEAQFGQNQGGYRCSGSNCNMTVQITKWEGKGQYAEGTFSGTIPSFGDPIYPFDGSFEGSFRGKIKN
jgi:hypothetical protein